MGDALIVDVGDEVIVVEAVPEAEGVAPLVFVPDPVDVGVLVGERVAADVGDEVAPALGVTLGLAPKLSDEVGDATAVRLLVRVPVGVAEPVDVTEGVAVGVNEAVCDGVSDSDSLGESEPLELGDVVCVAVSDGLAPKERVAVNDAVLDGVVDCDSVVEGDGVLEKDVVVEGVTELVCVGVPVAAGVCDCDAVGDFDGVPLLVAVTENMLGDLDGLAPFVKDDVGDAEKDVEGVALGVKVFDGVTVPVAVLDLDKDGDDVPLTVPEEVSLGVADTLIVPESDDVSEGDAPRDSDAVGVAVLVGRADRLVLGVGTEVGLDVLVAVGVTVGDVVTDAVPDLDLVATAVREGEARVAVREAEAPELRVEELDPVTVMVLVDDAVPDPVLVDVGVRVGDAVMDGVLPVDKDAVGVPVGELVTDAVPEADVVVDGVPVGVKVFVEVFEMDPVRVGVVVGDTLMVDVVEPVTEGGRVLLGVREVEAVIDGLAPLDSEAVMDAVGDDVRVEVDVRVCVGDLDDEGVNDAVCDGEILTTPA